MRHPGGKVETGQRAHEYQVRMCGPGAVRDAAVLAQYAEFRNTHLGLRPSWSA